MQKSHPKLSQNAKLYYKCSQHKKLLKKFKPKMVWKVRTCYKTAYSFGQSFSRFSKCSPHFQNVPEMFLEVIPEPDLLLF